MLLAFRYAIEILPSSKQGGKGKRKVCFLSDVHVVCLLLFKKRSIRARNSAFSHIWKVYRLFPLIVLLITYGCTYIISRLYCIIPCFFSKC